MFKYPFLSGIFLPFKIYSKTGICIQQGAQIELSSRVVLGNASSDLPIVSRLPINIYFGRNSKIKFGKSISIGAGVNIVVKDNGFLNIGDNTYFTSDAHLEAVNSIAIGSGCAISWGVTIIDDDHHTIYSGTDKSVLSEQKPFVKIGDKVWIGCNTTILKNTVIGNNCIIGANSLVKGEFPDNCLIAGNPAKIIKQSVLWK
jgi:acetyltransferase-like isoleucine patch superfamily enzyme